MPGAENAHNIAAFNWRLRKSDSAWKRFDVGNLGENVTSLVENEEAWFLPCACALSSALPIWFSLPPLPSRKLVPAVTKKE